MYSSKIKSKKFLLFLVFLLPIAYLGGGGLFSLFRLAVAFLLFLTIYQSCKFKNKGNRFFIVFFCLLCIYMLRTKAFHVLPPLIIFSSIYMLVFKTQAPLSDFLKSFSLGALCTGLIGFFYMVVSNKYIRGGDYTENALHISNLTVPINLCLFIIYDVFRTIERRKKILIHILANLLLFAIVVFLEKRGPILFCVISIILALFIKDRNNIKKIILVALFAYPFYEIPLMQIVVKNNHYIESVFERSGDFEDIERNPRIKRLLVANAFVSDVRIEDLWGYHKELNIIEDRYDKIHNHFHNALLQLYYERGAISVLLIFIILLTLRFSGNKNYSYTLFSMLTYCFFIGTSESGLMSSSCPEMLTTVLLLLAQRPDEGKKNL